ncbi:MAG: prolyl oligopeptidase family serine peptidase, partial [Armatimonadota bacterium]
LTAGTLTLGKEIEALRQDLKNRPQLLRFLPDVQIFHNAVRYPLQYNEFYDPREIATAKALLAQGMDRAKLLRAGDTPWTKQSGLMVFGYISKIDGSVQPYGLVVPETFAAGDGKKRRLDFFCHGRGEKLTELSFINGRQKSPGEFTPPDAFVLHPYGRYCNANRFAGEVDVFEALADIKSRYSIDSDRIVARGFSMGGASAWQFATHHSDQWAAASPGAGFSETVGFLRLDAPGKEPRPWYEQKLWHWYDSTDYALNLNQCPVIAYNGDKDGQKQAADMMEAALAKEGMTLTRVIGPDTGHSYHPESKKEINAKVDVFVAKGRETMPAKIHFTTWTLRYNTMNWLTVTGLDSHWERARVDAERTDAGVALKTQNVARFSLSPAAVAGKPVTIDGQKLNGSQFVKNTAGRWSVDKGKADGLRKSPGLQGPIDDAFMDRFVMVRPTGKPMNAQVGSWVDSEMSRAVREWRATFRGEALVKDDKSITPADMTSGNLVLWGDPSSNTVLAKIASKLPVRWEKDGSVKVGGKTYPAGTSVPVLIYPNPLNPKRYVVLNSCTTFREADYTNNDRQYAHLPDWAVIDITTPPNKTTPGRIADAGFFDEQWKLKASETK